MKTSASIQVLSYTPPSSEDGGDVRSFFRSCIWRPSPRCSSSPTCLPNEPIIPPSIRSAWSMCNRAFPRRGGRSKKEALPPASLPTAAKARPKEKEKPVSLATKPKEDEAKINEAIERLRQRREGKKVDTAIDRLRQRQEEKNMDSAIDRIRGEREAKQIDSAIERIRKRVTIGSAGAVETGEAGTGGASSGFMSIKHKMYYNLIWQRIRSAWVLPEGALGGKKDLETIIAIRIAKDGQIEEIQFEKKSGNAQLDESALRAIKKANPLPPLPPGFEGDKFDVGVRFTPSDL